MNDKYYYECMIDSDMAFVVYRKYVVDEEKNDGFWLRDLEDDNRFFYSRLVIDKWCGTTKEEALDKFIKCVQGRVAEEKKKSSGLRS